MVKYMYQQHPNDTVSNLAHGALYVCKPRVLQSAPHPLTIEAWGVEVCEEAEEEVREPRLFQHKPGLCPHARPVFSAHRHTFNRLKQTPRRTLSVDYEFFRAIKAAGFVHIKEVIPRSPMGPIWLTKLAENVDDAFDV